MTLHGVMDLIGPTTPQWSDYSTSRVMSGLGNALKLRARKMQWCLLKNTSSRGHTFTFQAEKE